MSQRLISTNTEMSVFCPHELMLWDSDVAQLGEARRSWGVSVSKTTSRHGTAMSEMLRTLKRPPFAVP